MHLNRGGNVAPTEETLHVTTRSQWRRWLKKNAAGSRGIWLIYHKKHTGQPRIPYEDAVEEAICFGWIDSTVRRLDEEKFMQLFLPRRSRNSNWSANNRRRAEKLLAAGLVQPQGLARIEEARQNGAWGQALADTTDLEMPDELAAALADEPRARAAFDALPEGKRRNFLGWVWVARKPETRQRRAAEAVQRLVKGQDLGMK
jgi:uncharacterized protein YdeI (YjbR/CyaY-like superfamily)